MRFTVDPCGVQPGAPRERMTAGKAKVHSENWRQRPGVPSAFGHMSVSRAEYMYSVSNDSFSETFITISITPHPPHVRHRAFRNHGSGPQPGMLVRRITPPWKLSGACRYGSRLRLTVAPQLCSRSLGLRNRAVLRGGDHVLSLESAMMVLSALGNSFLSLSGQLWE